jgi:hypothetical protein
MDEENANETVFGQHRIVALPQLDRDIVEPLALDPVAQPLKTVNGGALLLLAWR